MNDENGNLKIIVMTTKYGHVCYASEVSSVPYCQIESKLTITEQKVKIVDNLEEASSFTGDEAKDLVSALSPSFEKIEIKDFFATKEDSYVVAIKEVYDDSFSASFLQETLLGDYRNPSGVVCTLAHKRENATKFQTKKDAAEGIIRFEEFQKKYNPDDDSEFFYEIIPVKNAPKKLW